MVMRFVSRRHPVTDMTKAENLMSRAWTTRRESFKASARSRSRLIQHSHNDLTIAMKLARKANDEKNLAQAMHLLANVEIDMGQYEKAESLWLASVELCRKIGDKAFLAHKVRHLGDIYKLKKRFCEASTCYNEALTLYRSLDDPPKLDFANALQRMALHKEATGLNEESIRLWREARHYYELTGILDGVRECSSHLKKLKEYSH